MKLFITLLPILFWTRANSFSPGGVGDNDGLANFLSSAMANYSTWLSENGLDPSPPNPKLINLFSKEGGISKVKLNCQLSNFHISGHSNNSVESSNAEGNLEGRYFKIDRYEETKYSGNYVAEGNFTDSSGQVIFFNGSGPWYATFSGPMHSILGFENFQINSDGYIDLMVPPGELDYVFGFNLDEFYFEGLFDEGGEFGFYIYVETVHLLTDYLYANAKEDLPGRKLLTEYLSEMFSKIPVSEIVDWPSSI